jgi:hypothetical protein
VPVCCVVRGVSLCEWCAFVRCVCVMPGYVLVVCLGVLMYA